MRSAAKATIAAWRCGELGHVAAHVVEQDGEVVGPQRVEMGELARQRVLPAALGRAVQLERAEADAEAHAERAAMRGERGQRLHLRIGMQLLPVPAQIGVGLGCVEVETVAVRREEGDRLGALPPAPRPAEKAFDQAELGRHAACSSALIAAWTRLSTSARGRPGGIGSPNRIATDAAAPDQALARPQPAAVERDRHDRQAERR